eukprot:SAG11_NODE_3004_length_2774_cov_1.712897_2_plen_41_part_00
MRQTHGFYGLFASDGDDLVNQPSLDCILRDLGNEVGLYMM